MSELWWLTFEFAQGQFFHLAWTLPIFSVLSYFISQLMRVFYTHVNEEIKGKKKEKVYNTLPLVVEFIFHNSYLLEMQPYYVCIPY